MAAYQTTLEPSIPMRDKDVSFDVHIAIYKDSLLKKSPLLGHIVYRRKNLMNNF